jgi:serine/threonine-protein kinase HipA
MHLHHILIKLRNFAQDISQGVRQGRRMVASAMTLLERHDGQAGGSYLHIVEAIETLGGKGLTEDLEQLFRRAVFNLLVGNRDDHLRNHGFLLTPSGWQLLRLPISTPTRPRANTL